MTAERPPPLAVGRASRSRTAHRTFPLVCERLLHGIPLTFVVFDVLELEGDNLAVAPSAQLGEPPDRVRNAGE
jgi:hypothetical protein